MSEGAALLVVDVQAGSFTETEPAYGGQDFVERIRTLIDQCRTANIPIIYIQHSGGKGDPDEPGTPGWPIHPRIEPDSADSVVQKRNPDAFHETELQALLDAKGINKLIIAGIQTEYCVDTTTRRAFSLGYDVTLVGDCHTTWDGKQWSAEEKIQYHNQVLGGWFSKVKSLNEIEL